MSIEEIPSDKPHVMTDVWFKSFRVNGCTPCCHSCGEWINVGDDFMLMTIKSRLTKDPERGQNYVSVEVQSVDAMVCTKCDLKKYEKSQYASAAEYERKRQTQGGGCFRVNGKIVH